MRKFLLLSWFICLVIRSLAQPPDLDSVKLELYRVNKVFDSSRYLGFDVRFVYRSDTSFGIFENDEAFGQYILNNRNLYYKMGDAEYIQTDSFIYNIYHEDKMLIMSREPAIPISNMFPLRAFADSIITWYDTSYTITMQHSDSINTIHFKAKYDTLPYQHFSIGYAPYNYYPSLLEFTILEAFDPQDLPDSLLNKVKIKSTLKKVSLFFENYYHPTDIAVFADQSYVTYDRYRKVYRPIEKFEKYRFVTHGVGDTISQFTDGKLRAEDEPIE